jgi:leucyl aminopeptidase
MKHTACVDLQTDQDIDLLVVPICYQQPFPQRLSEINKALEGGLEYNLKREKFTGDRYQKVLITTNGKHPIPKVLLIGLGKREELSPLILQELGGWLCPYLQELCSSSITIENANLTSEEIASIAFGVWLRRCMHNKYCTNKQQPFTLKICCESEKLQEYRSMYQGINLARDLTSEPANVLFPQAFAERCLELRSIGLEVTVLDEKQLARLGVRGMLAVGAGSSNPPRLVVLEWKGVSASQPPIALVGKGVCFDAGGINIKTDHLLEMKMDKAGAATVVGTMQALALMNSPVNVVGVIGLAENMPDGKALKPSDVISMYSGKTVEVVDTDNEGRLILADCLWYVQKHYSPKAIVDLGTLTLETFGALGGEYAGLFSEDKSLSETLIAAGNRSGEKLWPLPMGEPFAKQIESSIADIKNAGIFGYGESSAAAEFLKCFIRPDLPWAHLDIAGVAWSQEDKLLSPKGVTGFGVKLLVDWILTTDEL